MNKPSRWGARAGVVAGIAVSSCSAAPEAAPVMSPKDAAGARAATPPDDGVRVLRTLGDVTLVSAPARGFEHLSEREHVLAYHLQAAALAGDTLFTHQTSRYALPVWELVRQMLQRSERLPPELHDQLLEYRRWLFVFHGLHDKVTARKYPPPIARQTFEAGLRAAGLQAPDELLAALFDPNVLPNLINKTPGAGRDPIVESAANHYEGLTSTDLENYHERFALNGRLVKRGTRIEEQVYRTGNATTPAGLGAQELGRVVSHLEAACEVAPPAQRRALEHLIEYFRTGEARAFREHDIAWLAQPFRVDYILGFLESYADVRQRKGDFFAFVGIPDPEIDPPLKALAQAAAYYEEKLPWAAEYKRNVFRPPAVSALNAIATAADAGPITFGGVNLPNPQDLRQEYGTKNFINVTADEARRKLRGSAFVDEYAPAEVRAELTRCAAWLDYAFLGFHEVTGHGSGSVSPALSADPAELLGSYFSTLEEARADLVADYLAFEPKTIEIGLLPDAGCARIFPAATALRWTIGFLQVPNGDRAEEDHLRAAFLQLGVMREKGVAAFERRDGKIYLIVRDVDAWRTAVGELLGELHTIKATGNRAAIEQLTQKHAIRLDTALRDEIVARRPMQPLAQYVAPLPPLLRPIRDAAGRVIDARAEQVASLDEYIEAVARAGQ